jgi:ribosome maturation protein Sdo1
MYNNDDRHGNQGTLDTASKASLENEFSTKSEDECLKIILEKGKVEKGGVCLPHAL